MAKKSEEGEYKNKVVFLRKSKAGNHLYAFNHDNAFGADVESLIIEIKELIPVLQGKKDWAKVGITEKKE